VNPDGTVARWDSGFILNDKMIGGKPVGLGN
jgi:hypothetical protein